MPTFTTSNIDTPDIDPDALTVRLLGPEPDADDLVKAPENVTMPEELQSSPEEIAGTAVESNSAPEEYAPVSDETPSSSDSIISLDVESPEDSNVPPDMESQDEEEIKAIEEMLRSKKSKRKALLATKIEKPAKVKKPVKKIDPFVIVFAVVATLLIIAFVIFFGGFFKKTANLGMTMNQFSTKYEKTAAFGVLKEFGFLFPEVTYDDSTTDKDLSNFSGIVENTANYSVAVSGSVTKSDSIIKAVRVYIQVTSSQSFDDLCLLYSPYIQVFYPNMSTKDATAYLSTLYTSKDPITVKGSYGLAMRLEKEKDYSYCVLDIISSKDAKSYREAFTTTGTQSETPAAALATTTPAASS